MLTAGRLVLAGLLAAGIGVGSGSAQQEATTSPATGSKTPLVVEHPEMRSILYHSVVRFPGDNPGSGFVVGGDRHIVTAWHVLSKLNSPEAERKLHFAYQIETYNPGTGQSCTATADLIGASEYRDVAVLRLAEDAPPDCVAHLRPIRVEWDAHSVLADMSRHPRLIALGAPDSADCRRIFDCLQVFSHGIRQLSDRSGYIVLEEPAWVGMSGGPAVLSDGSVIGMVVQAGKDDYRVGATRVVPMEYLSRAFWTFGIMPFDDMSDYFDELNDLLSKAERLRNVLDAWEELERSFERPSEAFLSMAEQIRRFGHEFNAVKWGQPMQVEAPNPFGQTRHFIHLPFKISAAATAKPVKFQVVMRCQLKELNASPPPEGLDRAQIDEQERTLMQYHDLEFDVPFTSQPANGKPNLQAVVTYHQSDDEYGLSSGILAITKDVEDIRSDCANYHSNLRHTIKIISEKEGYEFSIEKVEEESIVGVELGITAIFAEEAGGAEMSEALSIPLGGRPGPQGSRTQ